MEEYLNINKGLNQDFDPISQPSGTYRNLINGNRLLDGTLTNEKGFILLQDLQKTIVGSYVLDTDIILALYPSEIGILDKDDVYTTITTNSDLNFTSPSLVFDYIVDITGKKNFKGERIIYLADGVNPDRAINLDDSTILSSPNFGDITQIQLNPILPTIQLDSVTDQGELPTGVYQFGVRLLTRSTNATSFSDLTSLIPIIDESSSAAIDLQDGAPPQTPSSKSINLIINNIDTNYSFIEIVAITYLGTANITSSNIVARLPIDNRATIQFTYGSITQNKESITLEDITVSPIIYTASKSIEQKDNILVRSNLTAEDNSYNFQEIANNIKIKYFIEQIPYQPGYKDAINAALKKGYRRGEVYSFGIVPDYKNNANSTAYHIPAPFPTQAANTLTKQLGTYTSTATYPDMRGYPTNDNHVRHFRMPTVEQEPHFVNIAGQDYIRILGIEIDTSAAYPLIPTNILNKLNGFRLVRQERRDQDKSILSQGIANHHYVTGILGNNGTLYELQVAGNVLYGNTAYIRDSNPSAQVGSISTSQSIGFFSPETIFYEKPIVGTNLKLRADMLMTGSIEKLRGTQLNAYFTINYTNRKSGETMPNPITINPNSAEYIPATATGLSLADKIYYSNNSNININKLGVNGYLFMSTPNNLPQTPLIAGQQGIFTASDDGELTVPEIFYVCGGAPSTTNKYYLNGQLNANTGTSAKYLFSITRDISSQYGEVFDATYINIGKMGLNPSITYKFFGGDTFISKFYFMATHTIVYAGNNPNEIDFKALTSYFVESDINTGYRHYIASIGKEGDDVYVQGTVPYYPKYPLLLKNTTDGPLGLFEIAPQLGHSRGYNKQYSFDSNLLKFFPKQLAEEIVSKFENRSIYSEQAIEGEQVDAFRIFLPNNYHDIPKDRGPIINTFIHKNKFFIHTTGSIYATAFNEKAAINSTAGEIVLGNGGVFNRPSEPITTVNGGYAGIQTKHGISTPFGYLFVDSRQKLMFQFDEQLSDISEQGLVKHFNTIEESDRFVISFDYEFNRFILTCTTAGNGLYPWTLSYHSLLKSWSSYHTYIPNWIISRGKQLYSGNTTKIFKNNRGSYGTYYDSTIKPMIFDFSINDNPSTTKIFDNLVLYTTSKSDTSIGIGGDTNTDLYNTISQLQVFNETKNTGLVDIIVPTTFEDEFSLLQANQCFAKLKNDEFRIAIPSDLVIDINNDIFDDSNLSISRDYTPRMSGKWCIVRLIYNNAVNDKLTIHSIKKIFRDKTRLR